MPIYVYACQGCGQNFEIKQRFVDDALTVHDTCGGAVKRVLQPVGIVFKGTGWYITDSRSSSESATIPSAVPDKKPVEARPADASTTTSSSSETSPASAPAPSTPASSESSSPTAPKSGTTAA